MKQTTIALLILSALAFASVANAQDNRGRGSLNSGPGSVRIDDHDEERERALRLATSSRRLATSTARRIELRRDIAQRRAEHTGKKLLATIERLEKLTARIESRIAKVEANGGTASTSKRFVAEAKEHLLEAREGLEAFSSIELSGDKVAENFERIRAAAAFVKEELREAHESLVAAIRALKPGRTTNNATSTRATTTSQ